MLVFLNMGKFLSVGLASAQRLPAEPPAQAEAATAEDAPGEQP